MNAQLLQALSNVKSTIITQQLNLISLTQMLLFLDVGYYSIKNAGWFLFFV